MPSAKRSCLTAAMIVVALFLPCSSLTPLFADSYTMTTVGIPQDSSFLGIDNAGDYILNITNSYHGLPICGGVSTSFGSSCFETIYANQSTPVFSTTPTNLKFADGSSCSITGSGGFSISSAICDNGHMLFSGEYTADGVSITGTWSGFDPVADYLGSAFMGSGFINKNGDAVFTDSIGNDLIYADDLTPPSTNRLGSSAPLTNSPVPEPSTLLLVGTGGLSLITAIRRRLRA